MSQIAERSGRNAARPMQHQGRLAEWRHPHEGGGAAALRVVGALAVLAVGIVHLEQYFAVHYNVVPVIGPLFALNFAGATLIALGLLLPLGRLHIPLALAGIGLAATSFVFLFISEHQPLFGFQEYGYRAAIIIALAAEAIAVVSLGGYLAARSRRART